MNNFIQKNFTTTNILLLIGIINLIFMGAVFSYILYTNNITDQYRDSTNHTAIAMNENTQEIKIGNQKIIENQNNNSEQIRINQKEIRQTQEIQNQTGQKTLRYFTVLFNKIANNTDTLINLTRHLENSTNQTNTLVKFLTDNFGSKSGYLERENFQYDRANKTFEMINAIYNRTN